MAYVIRNGETVVELWVGEHVPYDFGNQTPRDFGDWLVCDGREFPTEKYPELAKF